MKTGFLGRAGRNCLADRDLVDRNLLMNGLTSCSRPYQMLNNKDLPKSEYGSLLKGCRR